MISSLKNVPARKIFVRENLGHLIKGSNFALQMQSGYKGDEKDLDKKIILSNFLSPYSLNYKTKQSGYLNYPLADKALGLGKRQSVDFKSQRAFESIKEKILTLISNSLMEIAEKDLEKPIEESLKTAFKKTLKSLKKRQSEFKKELKMVPEDDLKLLCENSFSRTEAQKQTEMEDFQLAQYLEFTDISASVSVIESRADSASMLQPEFEGHKKFKNLQNSADIEKDNLSSLQKLELLQIWQEITKLLPYFKGYSVADLNQKISEHEPEFDDLILGVDQNFSDYSMLI